MASPQLPLPVVVGAAVGGAALALLIVLLWFLVVRSRKAHRDQNAHPHSHLHGHYMLPNPNPTAYSHARSLHTPDPVWLADEKGRSSPSAGSDANSQTSSRYGPAPQLKISTPMPQRPRRISNNLPSPLSLEQKPALSNLFPNNSIHPVPDPPQTLGNNSMTQGKRLDGILEDDKAVAARFKEALRAGPGPGARWLETAPVSAPSSRSRARETTTTRQSFMTATTLSVYSDHGPDPVGVAYGGEEYE